MSTLDYLKMPFSAHGAWDKLSQVHPAIWKTLLSLVLPLSLIPPAMLIYAGGHHPEVYWMTASAQRFQMIAALFLVAELCTVPLMAQAIKTIAEAHHVRVELRDTLLLAAISAVPMWLSALALAIPSLLLTVSLLVVGLLAALMLLFQGSTTILKISNDMEAQEICSQAYAVGALVWTLLCVFVKLSLMS
jgi:hypothetical protein